jgi:hypothetical protein
LAIFYKFLQAEGLYPWFDGSNGKTKGQMCEEIGARHNVSSDNFEQKYNKTDITKASSKDVQKVILMLDTPEQESAKKSAETRLRIIEAKAGIK